MSAQAPALESVPLAPGDLARIWGRHLISLLLPANALLFLFSGPHPWYLAPVFMLPVVGAFVLDNGPRVERRQPRAELPAWPFDLLVYGLAALQLAVVVGIARLFASQDLLSVDMVVLVTVVGGSSGFSIITAHELIHRRRPWERSLGRLLLCTVLQEHFFTEHLRGHHVRVGTPEDPATARFGEDYRSFYRRTVPAQLRSAWALEKRRLGDERMSNLDPRMLRNRIVHGIVVGWGMAFAVAAWAGLAALVAFLLQAFFASRLLEAVNYFEHWGLVRRGSRVHVEDSWDTHSWFTYYGLIGLSRHADHHYEQTRPYQQLRIHDEAPRLPTGYVGMVDMVMTKNDEFQRLATAELRRRGLGPFRDGAEPVPPGPEPSSAAEAGWLSRWRSLPPSLRLPAGGAAFVAAVTALGASLGENAFAFAPQLLWNAWILAAFVIVFRVVRRVEEHETGPLTAWSVGLALLLALGLASDRLLSLLA